MTRTKTALLILLGAAAVMLACNACYSIGAASAAVAAPGPVVTAEASVDASWSLIEAYGWIWGSMAVLFGGLAAFLKRNESQRWIAQGRTLAILVAVAGVGAAIVEAGVAGAPWTGILYTAILAAFKVINPTVLPSGAPAGAPTAPPSGSPPTQLAAVIAVIALAGLGATQQGCAAVRSRGSAAAGAFIDCQAPNVAGALGELVPLAKQAVMVAIGGAGDVDLGQLRAAATPLKSDLGRCALAAAIAALSTPEAPDPDAPAASPLEVDGPGLRAAFARVRGELGWAPVVVGDGTVL